MNWLACSSTRRRIPGWRSTYGLVPGRYRWYVWPGIGQLADGRYGDLLGSHVFVVVR